MCAAVGSVTGVEFMRSARVGAARPKAQIQVSRTGTSDFGSPRAPSAQFSQQDVIGDCSSHAASASRRASISSSPTRPTICSSNRLSRPDQSVVDAVDDDWDKFAVFRLRRLHPRLAVRRAARDEAGRHDLRDRLLSQHLSRRRDHAGPRVLDPERHRLAQGQSDAEFSRPPLHQRARNDDLGGARRVGAKSTRSITRR